MATPQPVTPLEERHREGMDRPIDAPRRWRWRLAGGLLLAVAAVSAVYEILDRSRMRTFAADPTRLTISTVEAGTFHDYLPVRGSVTPLDTVYLDAIEGGRIEKIFVEEGALVAAGQPLVELSNTALQLDVISREAQVTEQLNNLRNTRLALEQNRLALRRELVEIDYQITRLSKLVARRGALAERGLIAAADVEDLADELRYYRARRDVTLESQAQDERMRLAQIASLESGVAQLEKNLDIARRNLENLVIQAPMAGRLTALDAELGASKGRGERLGQIDDVDDFKVNARIDEFYVTRVHTGQAAELSLNGRAYRLIVDKVYPEIRDGQFQVDLVFRDDKPSNVRRGQTLQLEIALGDPAPALLLDRGGFFRDTGGRWAFVLDPSGRFAERRPLELGRSNPEQFEVISGVSAGERVITSEYGAFAGMDRIELER